MLRLAGGVGQNGQSERVQASDVCNVAGVDKLEQITVFDSVFGAHSLVLMVEVLAPFGEANGRETLAVEAAVVATAQIAVVAQSHDGTEGRQQVDKAGASVPRSGRRRVQLSRLEVCRRQLGDGAGEFTRRGVVLASERQDLALLLRRCRRGDRLGKDPNGVFALLSLSGGGVATDDVIIEHGDERPAFGFGERGEVMRSIEALFFPGDSDEDDGPGGA